jgi:hypothetical protein
MISDDFKCSLLTIHGAHLLFFEKMLSYQSQVTSSLSFGQETAGKWVHFKFSHGIEIPRENM